MLFALIEKSVLHFFFLVLHTGEYFIHEFRLITCIQQWQWFAYKLARKCWRLGMTSLTKCLSQKLLWDCLWMDNISFLGAKLMEVVYALYSGSFFYMIQFELKSSDISHWRAHTSLGTNPSRVYCPYILQFISVINSDIISQLHNVIHNLTYQRA